MDGQSKKPNRLKDKKPKPIDIMMSMPKPLVDRENLNKLVLKNSFDARYKCAKEMTRSIIVDDVLPRVIKISESKKRLVGSQVHDCQTTEASLGVVLPHSNHNDKDGDCDLVTASKALYLKDTEKGLFTDRRETDDNYDDADDEFANDFVAKVLSKMGNEEDRNENIHCPDKISEMLEKGTDADANYDDVGNDEFAEDLVLNVLSNIASKIYDQADIDAKKITKLSDDETREDNENDEDGDDDLAGEIVTSVLSVIVNETQNGENELHPAAFDIKDDEVKEAIVYVVMMETEQGKLQLMDKVSPKNPLQINDDNEELVETTENSTEGALEAITKVETEKADDVGSHKILEPTALVLPQAKADEVREKIRHEAEKNVPSSSLLPLREDKQGEKLDKAEDKLNGNGHKNCQLDNLHDQNIDVDESQTFPDLDNKGALKKNVKKSFGSRIMGWFRKTFRRKRPSGSRGCSLFCCTKDNRVHPDDDID